MEVGEGEGQEDRCVCGRSVFTDERFDCVCTAHVRCVYRLVCGLLLRLFDSISV